MSLNIKEILISTFLFFFLANIKSEVIVNSLFTENAVLQQGVKVPVFGYAKDNEEITVSFGKQILRTITINGKWLVTLNPLKASSIPQKLIVKGSNTVIISNILVGEVWLCSGQSNMALGLKHIKPKNGAQDKRTVLKDAQNYPTIRQYTIKVKTYDSIPDRSYDNNGKWIVCDSTKVSDFSAVAFFFGRSLNKELGVPIGLLTIAYPGTPIEYWISKDSLINKLELKSVFENYTNSFKNFPAKLKEFKENQSTIITNYKNDSVIAVKNNRAINERPKAPVNPAERGGPSGLFNAMISPLIPFAIKGCLWYQGENNSGGGNKYRQLLPLMIKNWRQEWQIGEFPFIIVQIPGWKTIQPELREAQLLTSQNVKNTSLVVINDCDDASNVHPGNKQPVGERAALQAQAIAYKKKIEYSGPIYKYYEIKGKKMILTFTHAKKGICSRNGDLKDFEICGADEKYFPATATIVKDKVIVESTNVANPTAVRMGWNTTPNVNLYNNNGLCASPFRTNVP